MNSCCKKWLALVLVLTILPAALSAGADTYWSLYRKPGEYTVEFTPEEDAQVTGIMEEAVRKSEGTPMRTDADLESAEARYERFISFHPDGGPVEYRETEYEDIGFYRWAAGIPDDRSISRDEAWKIALKFLLDEGLATPEILVHYYPSAAFDVGYDPENPIWKITPVCYDYEETDLPVTAWEVAVYAHDGSICGYREVDGAG